MKQSELAKLALKMGKYSGEPITEEDLIKAIKKIAKNHRKKKFAYFTSEDIESEVWIIVLEYLDTYDPSKGKGPSQLNSFERWFNSVVHSKLYNLHRDKYSSVNEKHKEARMNIMNCLDIDYIMKNNGLGEKYLSEHDHVGDLAYQELREFVEQKLSPECLEIYLHCIEEENVSPYYKTKLSEELDLVMQEWIEINKENA